MIIVIGKRVTDALSEDPEWPDVSVREREKGVGRKENTVLIFSLEVVCVYTREYVSNHSRWSRRHQKTFLTTSLIQTRAINHDAL